MLKRFSILLLLIIILFSTNSFAMQFKPSFDGIKEWKLGQKTTASNSESRKYLVNHSYYRELPLDLYEGSLYWKERLRLRIEGRLDEHLYVRYDIEEESDFPSKHNIFVKFYQHEFTFGDFEKNIAGGPFASVSKKLNGFMYSSENDGFNVLAILGEERSDTDIYILNGDGTTKTFKMRNNPIVEGSLSVVVNGSKLSEGSDYTVNYSTYAVTLKEAYSISDVIKFVYDYTNPVEEFLPIDRSQFKGVRLETMMTAETKKIVDVKKLQQYLEDKDRTNTSVSINGKVQETFKLKHKYLLVSSETVEFRKKTLSPKDYVVDYRRGYITIPRFARSQFDRVKISYSYYEHGSHNESFNGVGTIGPYFLKNAKVVEGTSKVKLNGRTLRYKDEYSIDFERGSILFKIPINAQDKVSASYEYFKTRLPSRKKLTYNWFSGGFTYLQKRAKSQKSTITDVIGDEEVDPSVAGQIAVYHTKEWPLYATPDITIDGDPISLNSAVEVDFDLGRVTIDFSTVTWAASAASTANLNDPTLDIANLDTKFSYKYYKEKGPQKYSFRIGPEYEEVDIDKPSENITARKYLSSIDNHIKKDRLESRIIVRYAGQALELNKDYEIDYEYENGRYNGQVYIVLYNQQYDEGVVRDPLWEVDDTLEVEYYYVLQNVADAGFFQHDVMATDIHLNFDDKVKVNIDAAYSTQELERTVLSSPGDKLNLTGQWLYVYKLNKGDIVQGSERIEINGKITPMTPGYDYYLNYARGEIKFLKQAYGSNDEITVYYDYYSSDNDAGEKSKVRKKGYAAKIDSTYEDERLYVQGDFAKIEKDFKSMAGIQGLSIPVGSTEWGGEVKYKVMDNLDTYVDIRQTKTETNELQSDGKTTVYNVNDKYKYGAYYVPYKWLNVDAYQQVDKQVTDKQDVPSITGNYHTIDNKIEETGVKVGVGPTYFYSNINFKENKSVSGYLDGYNKETGVSNIWEIQNKYKPFNHITLDSEYGLSDYIAKDENSKPLRSDMKTYVGTSVASRWFESKVLLDAAFKVTNVEKVVSYNASEERVSGNFDEYTLKDQSYTLTYDPRWDYQPLKHFNAQIKDTYSETDGTAFSQKGKVSHARNYNMRFNPYSKARVTYAGTQTDSQESDGNIKRDSLSNYYTVSGYRPNKYFSLDNISYRKSNTNYDNKIPSNASRNMTANDFARTAYSFTVNPLDNLRYTYSNANETNDDKSTTIKSPTSDIRETEKPKSSYKHEINLDFRELYMPENSHWTLGKTNFTLLQEENNEDSSTLTKYYPTENFATPVDTDLSSSLKDIYHFKFTMNSKPFKLFTSAYIFDDKKNLLRADRTDDTKDIEKNINSVHDLKISYPIMKDVSLETSWLAEDRKEWEYINTTKDVSVDNIENNYGKNKISDKDEFVLGFKYNAFKYITLETAGGYTLFDEKIQDNITPTSSELVYKRYSLIPGVVLEANKLIEKYWGKDPGKFIVSYKHYFDFIDVDDGEGLKEGFRSELTMDYTPINSKNLKGTVTYSRKAVWGVNANDAQQGKDRELGQNQEDTTIEEQNYFEEEGKANLEITIPISIANAQHVINNIKINLTAVLVQSKDFLDDQSDKNYYLWSWLGTVGVEF